MLTIQEMKKIYLKHPSVKKAAKVIGISEHKLRDIRNLEGWPRRRVYTDVKSSLRKFGHSLYDAIQSDYTRVPELDLP